MTIHAAAADGYRGGSGSYAASRPTYHTESLDELVELLGRERWVDLGAGTGIATAALVERGVGVTAVEPVAEMRARLVRSLSQVETVDGVAHAMPLPDGSASVVLAAQAFHWFDHGPALDEIVRVLKPGGSLVTLWNVRDESVPWVAAYTEISNRHAADTPRWYTMVWRRAIEADRRLALTAEESRPNPFPSSPDLAIDRLLSTSYIAALDEATRMGLANELRAVVKPLGDVFDYPYRTEYQVWTLGDQR